MVLFRCEYRYFLVSSILGVCVKEMTWVYMQLYYNNLMKTNIKLITTYNNIVKQLLEYVVQLVGFISLIVIDLHINVAQINQIVDLI
jgi:hypothetical protein